MTLRIPIGSAGTEIQFDGGDSRTLLFSSSAGAATLEGQVIGTSSTSPTPLTAASASAMVVNVDDSEISFIGDAHATFADPVVLSERYDFAIIDSFSFA